MVLMDSLSSSLILGVTFYRNQSGIGNKCLAQAGYALTAAVAVVESVAALTFSTLALAYYPLSSVPFEKTVTWLKSSSFSMIWSATHFALNPFVKWLVADERSARQIVASGQFLSILPNATYECW